MTNRQILQDKVAIVTGAGSGIGAASALRFAAEGARVLLADIRQHKAEQIAAEARELGGIVSTTSVDVANSESVEANDCNLCG